MQEEREKGMMAPVPHKKIKQGIVRHAKDEAPDIQLRRFGCDEVTDEPEAKCFYISVRKYHT